jgi:hypothetical protein
MSDGLLYEYTFQNADGEWAAFTTFGRREACEYAETNRLRMYCGAVNSVDEPELEEDFTGVTDDEAALKARLDEVVRGISAQFGIGEGVARPLLEAVEPLWQELAQLGWTDSYGGEEFARVFPRILAILRDQANVGPDETIPG